MKIAIFGLGYVGCVSAACFAKLGHTVVGVDNNANKVEQINAGQAPFFEPGLQVLLTEALREGRLSAHTSAGELLLDAEVVLICVGTPSDEEGRVDMSFLHRVCEEIAAAPRPSELIVSIRSTVFPGANEEIHRAIFHSSPSIHMVANPEFLREGSAVKDFLEPSLIVVGGAHPPAVERVAALYGSLACPVERVALRTAETIKFACNAFHAVKIAFANEIGSLCRALGVPGGEVMNVLAKDTKLNSSGAYLRPGFAFGGSCLPKDLRALGFHARRAAVQVPLLDHVLPSNSRHLDRLVSRVLQEAQGRIAIYGLAFKENTDDLRESAVLRLIDALLAAQADLSVYDPHIDLNLIHGANQRHLRERLPHVESIMVADFSSWLAQAGTVILTRPVSPGHRDAILQSGLPVLDLAS